MLMSDDISKLFHSEICRIVIAVLVLTSSVISALHFKETPIPEALLKPRNFNHHPYGQNHLNYHPSHHASVDLNAIDTDYVSHSVYNIDIQKPLPARHPSNGVYSQAPHQFPPTLPPGQNPRNLPAATVNYNRNNVEGDDNYGLTKKQYAFSYTVRDMHSGDDFSHTQQQKNGAVKGTYKVQLPDGRTQVVRYTADNDGYRADVSYLIDKNSVGYQSANQYNLANKVDEPQHLVDTYNPIYDDSVVGPPIHPIPSASTPIFVSTIKPPLDIHSTVIDDPTFESNKLTFEDRKSISAKPTFVLSAKSTHINDAFRIVPNSASLDENAIGIPQNPGLYFKIEHHQHHPVFYKTHP